MFFWHREVVVLHHQTCKLDKTPAMYATNSMFINSYLLGPFYKDISHDTCCFLKSNDIIISFVFHSNILFFYKTIHSSSSSDNSFFSDQYKDIGGGIEISLYWEISIP